MIPRSIFISLPRPRPSSTARFPSTQLFRRAMSQKSLFQSIKEDHEEMYEYHDQYERARARGDTDAQTRWVRQLTWEIARHAVGEELVVYPLMEKHLGATGVQLADHDRAEHQQVKERLYALEGLAPGSPAHHAALAEIMRALHHHNDDEEIKDLPLLERAIGQDASRDAALSFKKTKKLVPTRAHPSIPNKPPAETLLGLLEAPIDKIKDWFATFPEEEEMKGAKEELKTRDHDAAAGRAAENRL
ncbi:hypothetical protein B0H21DRAFT_744802 [Amylocystis lapponica]|nr:hypothetical protein B0H21DRAFT_744802 [Amylocystis lapponica]